MCKCLFPLIWVVTVTGCATTNSGFTGERSSQDRMGTAIATPFSDFNLIQTTIPPIIQAALKNPYQVPTDLSCNAISEQVRQLDTALGPDIDTTLAKAEKTAAERGGEFIQDEAFGAVERTVTGVIPFRGWIRKLTGADRHDKEVRAAIAAGTVRRAFLKGIGLERHCHPPAAPQILTVPQSPPIPPIVPSPLESVPNAPGPEQPVN